ncbi:MAG: hypothetical protein IH605_10415 [Burkholderiales bacterium]|nr:hypothetical protein [Burkholderiales bacterium]
MRALKNILTTRHAFVAEGAAWALPGEAVITTREAAGTKKETPAGAHLKNVALFLAAPFIGLAYLMTFPLVGLCMFAWLAGKKLLANKTARPIVLAAAAPFVTIAFVTVGPVVGLGALAWVGGRALLRS